MRKRKLFYYLFYLRNFKFGITFKDKKQTHRETKNYPSRTKKISFQVFQA